MKRVFSFLLVLTMVAALFAGCGDQSNMVTVKWYYGTELLKETQVEKGDKLTEWTPEKDDLTFDGWYLDVGATQKYDFSTAVNENLNLFANFGNAAFAEDNKAYYLVGTGKGDLSVSNWDQVNANGNLMMEKQSVEDRNVYTIEVKLYAGDQFQICHSGDWIGQQGIGHIIGAEHTDDSKSSAAVKNAAGETVFTGTTQFGKPFTEWNIVLAAGQDGIYKFTLETFPNNTDANTITYELVQKLDPADQPSADPVVSEMYIVGSFNGWNAEDENEAYRMAISGDNTYFVGYLANMEAGTAFKVVDHADGSWHPDGMGNDLILPDAGNYTVKYEIATGNVTFEKVEE